MFEESAHMNPLPATTFVEAFHTYFNYSSVKEEAAVWFLCICDFQRPLSASSVSETTQSVWDSKNPDDI